jgi:hypothetical protein
VASVRRDSMSALGVGATGITFMALFSPWGERPDRILH